MLKQLPQTIVFTRHPQCAHNVDHFREIERGVTNRDSPLTTRGEEQCRLTAEYLKSEFGTFDAVYCSEYRRTRRIPEAMGLGHLISEHPELNEWNMGVWQTMKASQVQLLYPDEFERFKKERHPTYRPLHGESIFDVDKRLKKFLRETLAPSGKKRVHISGHGGTGLVLRRILSGRTWTHWARWLEKDHPPNASVTVFEQKENHRYLKCTVLNYIPWAWEIAQVPSREVGDDA